MRSTQPPGGRRSRRSIFCGHCFCSVFYSVRLEQRLLVEQIRGLQPSCFARWFVGLGMDDAVCELARGVFLKNRDRLLTSDVPKRFFAEVNQQAKKSHVRRALPPWTAR